MSKRTLPEIQYGTTHERLNSVASTLREAIRSIEEVQNMTSPEILSQVILKVREGLKKLQKQITNENILAKDHPSLIETIGELLETLDKEMGGIKIGSLMDIARAVGKMEALSSLPQPILEEVYEITEDTVQMFYGLAERIIYE